MGRASTNKGTVKIPTKKGKMAQCQADCKTHRSGARLQRSLLDVTLVISNCLLRNLRMTAEPPVYSWHWLHLFMQRKPWGFICGFKWVSFIILYKFYYSYQVQSWMKCLTLDRKIPRVVLRLNKAKEAGFLRMASAPLFSSEYPTDQVTITTWSQKPGIKGRKNHPFDICLLLAIQTSY